MNSATVSVALFSFAETFRNKIPVAAPLSLAGRPTTLVIRTL